MPSTDIASESRSDRDRATRARAHLALAAKAWFAATALGQLAFAAFILLFYYPRAFSGNFAAWNDKPLIDGHIAGDTAGNLGFAMHVVLAAVITLCGLVQLIPVVRTRWPRLHRLSGRTFLASAMILALGGLVLVWVRGTYFNLPGALAISMDAGLILGCGAMAWRTALARDFAAHRRWALRTFVVASGVWFMRVGYMVWALATGGAGIGKAMDGPFDLFWIFGAHLLPLALLELYLAADRRGSPAARQAMAALLVMGSVAILAGSVGAWLAMWSPYI
jgi:hypothetical protein